MIPLYFRQVLTLNDAHTKRPTHETIQTQNDSGHETTQPQNDQPTKQPKAQRDQKNERPKAQNEPQHKTTPH
jgi:hypothetical protein